MRGSKRVTKGTKERPERWELRVYNSETGRYVSRTVSARSERAADRALAKLVTEIAGGRVPTRGSAKTVDEVGAQWLDRKIEDHQRGQLSDATVAQYEWAFKYIGKGLGSHKIRSLTDPTEIEDFYHALGKSLSAKSISQISGTLHQILQFARRHDYVRVLQDGPSTTTSWPHGLASAVSRSTSSAGS